MKLSQVKLKKILLELLAVISIAMLVFGGIKFRENKNYFIVIVLSLLILRVVFYLFKKLSIYFKTVFIKSIVKQELKGISYSPTSGFNRKIIYESGIVKRADKVESEDMIKGVIKHKTFMCSDIQLKNIYHSNNQKRVKTIFKGKMYIIDFEKPFSDDIFIIPSQQSVHFKYKDMIKVKTESMLFNQTFDVYAKNKKAVFYYLKPKLIEKFSHLSKYAHSVSISFKNNRLYIALNTKKDAFDLKMFIPLKFTYIDQIKKEIEEIKDIIALI